MTKKKYLVHLCNGYEYIITEGLFNAYLLDDNFNIEKVIDDYTYILYNDKKRITGYIKVIEGD